MHTHRGQLYIIAAPSGAGKTSLVSALLEAVPDVKVSISHTTRPKRPNEQHGINYFFIDEDTFSKMRERGEFLESATVFKYHYGTTRQWVEETLNQGIDVILEIDWQGARIVRQLMQETVGIFIVPPSLEVLKARLEQRASDHAEVIAERMAKAKEEISHYNEFDYLIVNDDFEEALSGLIAILQAERLKVPVSAQRHRSILIGLSSVANSRNQLE